MEDLSRIVAGIQKTSPLDSVRITGGEPLLVAGTAELISRLKELGIPKVSITTNGLLLEKKLPEVLGAGLDSVNLSLDTVDPEIFRTLTAGGDLSRVLAGLEAALKKGVPLKLNATLVRGINDSQVLPLLDFALKRNLEIRFIELMEMGHLHGRMHDSLFPMSEILEAIESRYSIRPLFRSAGSTARRWQVEGNGIFGIIPNASEPFCHDCDRLRLSSAGQLLGCLSATEGFQVDPGTGDYTFLLERAMGQKRRDHFTGSPRSMRSIGG